MAETVMLKNGSEVPAAAVATTMIALRELFGSQPVAFYELVQLARDPQHQLWGDSEQVLKRYAMLPLHGVTRDVIKSAVTGTDLDMALGNPVARDG